MRQELNGHRSRAVLTAIYVIRILLCNRLCQYGIKSRPTIDGVSCHIGVPHLLFSATRLGSMTRFFFIGLELPGALVGLQLVVGCGESIEPGSESQVNAPTETALFVGRDICVECHEQAASLYIGSDHDLAMQPANDKTVLGNFSNESFSHSDVTSTFSKPDGTYFVSTDGPDGALHEYPIAYTFGVRPLQQYLVELPGGRYQALSICWDDRPAQDGGKQWFHLYPNEKIDHADPLHWTKPLQNWNYMCAECHSTNLQKHYDVKEDRFATTWSEIDVSCEACHGPGSVHVNWARKAARGDGDYDTSNDGLLVRLRVPDESYWTFDEGAVTARRNVPLASNNQVESCGRCHSRRAQVWPEYRHGKPLADTHRVALLDEGLYHADGQILDEVYVHGSFLQSRMYHAGVTCTDCHEPHSAGLQAIGNGVCARCHLAPVFDTPEHHHHIPGPEGAQCVDCHMPSRNYMVVDPRRDHSFRVPRPDLTVKLGTPNACNGCHADQSPQWASETVVGWYGPERSTRFHFGEALHAGRRGLTEAETLLLKVIHNEDESGIARATAVNLLRSHLSPRSLTAIERALVDDDPLVRRSAASLLDALDVQTRWRLGSPLLTDPIRTVRLEAISALANVPTDAQIPQRREAFQRVVAEFREAQRFNADRPEAHVNLGNLEAGLGRVTQAEDAYRRAISMQPSRVPAYVNLADLLRATGRDAEGENVLRDALAIAPDSASVHHALGLLLIRQRNEEEAIGHLAQAVERRPDESRYAFVYGIALHDTGDIGAALTVLEQAHAGSPADRNVLQALISYNMELGNRETALQWARKLEDLSAPN